MKTLNLLMALLICGVIQAQVTMHIHYSDGTTLDIPGAEIDSVYYPFDPMNHAVYLTSDEVQSDPMMLIDSVTFSGVPPLPVTCLDGIQNNGEFAPDCGGPCPPCATCNDNIQNAVWVPSENAFFMEEGVDCGYPCPQPCPPSCVNGIQDGDEEGIDCGGSCPDPCPPALCSDGVWNGLETGIDCGGPFCPPCPIPTCFDGIQNQNETGIDCGGVCPDECPEPTCFDGVQNQGEDGIDCGGPCPVQCPPPSCNDGVQNQGEEWIDCGGPCPNLCPTCNDGVQNGPEAGNDCVIGDYPDYSGGMCPQCPTCDDGMLNNFETYIDCGGPNCPPCEMYLNAEIISGDMGSWSFFSENVEVIQQGFNIIVTATQTTDGQTETLSIRIPGMFEGVPEPLIPWLSGPGPSVRYTNFAGSLYDVQGFSGNMILTLVTLNHIMGEVDTATMVSTSPVFDTVTITGISFFVNL